MTAACTDPPTLWTKNTELKEQFANTVIHSLAQLKEKDFACVGVRECDDACKLIACAPRDSATIDGMNEDQQDVLMKFVYKGLATGEHPGLFKLHAALFSTVGHGCIVRALAERRTV